MKARNIAKAATFKSFLHLIKNTKLLFLWTLLCNTSMRQTLNDDFGGLHEDMNCAFPSMFSVNLTECLGRFTSVCL